MVFNFNINAFSNLTSIIYLYNENMNLEMTIKKLGSAHRVLRRSPHSVHVASLCGGKGANARFEVVSFQSE